MTNWRKVTEYRAQRTGQGKYTRKLRSKSARKKRRRIAKESKRRNRK